MFLGLKINEDNVCLMHIILQDKKYFLELTLTKVNVSTILGTTNLVESLRKVNLMLPNGTRFHINDVLYSRKFRRNLLSFKYIHRNGYHIETMNGGNIKYFYITSIISS